MGYRAIRICLKQPEIFKTQLRALLRAAAFGNLSIMYPMITSVDELAEAVDFFSIGTNDLTQYTLAIDRQNEKLDDFYNPHHKAILRMIGMVTENAHKCGKWAGICGELGADTALTEEFIRMGVDELSVAPSMVLKVRKRVREIQL